MKVTLNDREIDEALVEYVANQGISLGDKTVSVTIVSGRGSNGDSAIITIEDSSSESFISDNETPPDDLDDDDPDADASVFPAG